MAALLLFEQTAYASELAVTVDGEELSEAAFAQEGVTYAPLVPLLDALGGWETAWDPASRTASAETALFALDVPVGRAQVLADGFPYDLNASTLVLEGRTYVPLRSVANLLGAQVDFSGWDCPVEVRSAENGSYTQEDLYWLSRIISAESKGECLAGQIAVGNVILNRVASSTFPDTIREVVFDCKDAIQFEPVANGTIYDEPTIQSVLAAQLALNGTSVVGACLYFFNPDFSQGTWIRQNRLYFSRIGCHLFYQ